MDSLLAEKALAQSGVCPNLDTSELAPCTAFVPASQAIRRHATLVGERSSAAALRTMAGVHAVMGHIIPGTAMKTEDMPLGVCQQHTSKAGDVLNVWRESDAVRVSCSTSGVSSTARVINTTYYGTITVFVVDEVLVPWN
uniref:FAS1 domain-containing protein n=1 Tax=Dunaliella tertiolecta TaxID=3047 RepID=A0A7S3R9G8_DUNTE